MKYFNEFLDGELKFDVFINFEKVSIVRRIKVNYSINNDNLITNYSYYVLELDFKLLSI